MGDFKRKDAQKLAYRVVEMIEAMRTEMAGQDANIQRQASEIRELIDENARLRTALHLAVGELSTYGPMRYTSPEQLMQHFMEEARRG